MLPVMFKNSWFPTLFDDFLNTDFMPRANATAPAVNVKESDEAYTMEVAAPGIKKEYCRVSINDDGNLSIAIENKMEHKEEDKHNHYLRREFSYANYERIWAFSFSCILSLILFDLFANMFLVFRQFTLTNMSQSVVLIVL